MLESFGLTKWEIFKIRVVKSPQRSYHSQILIWNINVKISAMHKMKVRKQQHWDTLHVRPPPFCMLTKVRPFQLHDAKRPWAPNCELQSPSTKLAHHVQTEMHPKTLFIIQFIAPTPTWCGVIVWSKFYFHLSPSPLQHLSQNFCPSCLFALHTRPLCT